MDNGEIQIFDGYVWIIEKKDHNIINIAAKRGLSSCGLVNEDLSGRTC